MRLAVVVSIALLSLASSARADGWKPGWERWVKTTFMVGRPGMDSQTGEWLAILPVATSDCDMKVDKGHLQLLLGQMGDMRHAGFVADRMSHGFPNPLSEDWRIMVEESKTKACLLIDSQWGQDGDLFPGLIKPM